MRVLIALVGLLVTINLALAADGCGSRGGPGYRGPSGDCVGWASIGRICGYPPTTRCTPEHVAPGADEAANLGARIDRLKRRAHHEAEQ